MFFKSLLGVIAAGGLMFAASTASATVATYTDQNLYTANNGGSIGIRDDVDWGLFSQAQGNATANNSSVATGSTMTTVNGEKITATNGNSQGFTVYQNGLASGLPNTRWNGDFGNGVNVLSTQASSITLSFNGAITGFGIHAQTVLAGAYTFQIQAFNSAGGLLGTAISSGTSTGRTSNSFNSAAFAGLVSTAGDISYVTITATQGAASGFAIDTSLIYHFANNQTSGNQSQQTPEPGTLALLGAGLAALGAVRRRRQRA